MDRKREQLLVKRFPVFFQDYRGDMRKTCMAWGMSCGDGWYKLLWDTCLAVEKELEGAQYEFVAAQVKEKFGGLRFYYLVRNKLPLSDGLQKIKNISDKIAIKICRMGFHKLRWKAREIRQIFYTTPLERIDNIVNQAEWDSYRICERCGRSGHPQHGHWRRTLCNWCEVAGRIEDLKWNLKTLKHVRSRDVRRAVIVPSPFQDH